MSYVSGLSFFLYKTKNPDESRDFLFLSRFSDSYSCLVFLGDTCGTEVGLIEQDLG